MAQNCNWPKVFPASGPAEKMKTFPVLTHEGERTSAFEVESAYIGIEDIAQLLGRNSSVTEIERSKSFSGRSEVHIRFRYNSHPFVVWEAFGGSSRYWIGPQDGPKGPDDIGPLEAEFKTYEPSRYRVLLAEIVTLKFRWRQPEPEKSRYRREWGSSVRPHSHPNPLLQRGRGNS